METVRYTYRLRPGREAERALLKQWDACRWVWNQCIGRARDLWTEEGLSASYGVMSAELTDWRGRNAWLAAMPHVPQQQAIRTWASAHDQSFKRRSRCRFKSKSTTQPSMEYTRRGFTLTDGRLVLAGALSLPVVWSRPVDSPSSVRVFRRADGRWYASFVVRVEPEAFPAADAAIGVDWGVKTLAVTTDQRFDHTGAQHGKNAAERLAKAQRRMARRRPARGVAASKGYRTAQSEAARAYQSVAWKRTDDARKWARNVVEHHDKIAVEDFKPKFLAKSTMARKAADHSIGQFKRELVSYATRAGRQIVLVPPAYTSMTCSGCGVRTKRLLLSERVFCCPECGLVLDRDRNAARVILDAAGFNGACVEGVSHDPPSGVRAA